MSMPRYPVAARNGLVVSPNYHATITGVQVLQQGGNALDAAIAANAVLGVVEPQMCGLGGDLFLMVALPNGELHALNAAGRTPYAVDRGWFAERGFTVNPFRGPFAVSVPGVVDGWVEANRRFGSRPLRDLLAPAIAYAAEGWAVRRHTLKHIWQAQDNLRQYPTAAKNYLPGGALPRLGQVLRNPELAGALQAVADQGRDAVYGGGPVGAALLATLNAAGWPMSQRDLADTRCDWVQPISTRYRGCSVYQLPPPNQGIAPLIMLNILEGYDLAALGPGTAETIHLQVEAKRRAFAVRDQHCADPAFYRAPLEELLSPEFAARLRAGIDPRRVTDPGPVQPPMAAGNTAGDTIYLAAVDRTGMCVSLIQSNYSDWGSGVMVNEMGFFLHNRGCAFQLDPAHPNAYAPHRRPFHTLIPAMAFKDGRPWLVFGTRGADGQPQTQVQLLCNLVDFGMNPQQAQDAPRWRGNATYQRPAPDPLLMEGRFPQPVRQALAAMGHQVETTEDFADEMGHASVIELDQEQGVYLGAYDPRSDGAAIGW